MVKLKKINLDSIIRRGIFSHTKGILCLFSVITMAMLYFAWQLKVDASFEKNIPLTHEYMETYIKHQANFGGGNRVLLVLEDKSGSIFNRVFFEALSESTQQLAAISSVSEPLLRSLFTPNMRFVEVVEDGMVGGPVIPATFDGSAEQLKIVRDNILKADLVGRMVANNFASSMISAQLLSIDPNTQEKTDLIGVAKKLESVRQQIESKYANVRVHIIGFAKMMGDISQGARQVVFFFLIAFLITAGLVYWYSKSVSLTVLPLLCSLVAVVWQLGLLALLGFGIDPMSILVPFLVFAIGVSHGVQMINSVGKNVAAGSTALQAAYGACCRLFVPGVIALVSDTVGFLTLLLIDIDIIKELAITASIGVAVIIVTNLILLPVLLTYARFPPNFSQNVEKASQKQVLLWRFLASFARGQRASTIIIVTVFLTVISLMIAKNMQVGDLRAGAPALKQNSVYNVDNRFVTDNFSIGTDMLSVIVETVADGCSRFDVMSAIDKFHWNIENLPVVQSVMSLPSISTVLNAGFYEGALQWRVLPREQSTLVQSIRYLETSSGLLNNDCSVMPVLIFLRDHKAQTISQVIDAVKAYIANNETDDVTFRLATGPIGVMAATNEVVADAQLPMLIWVYSAVTFLCLISFRSIRATLCIIIPLVVVSIMVQALMVLLAIGLTVATLPVIALGVGIGVDYGIYIFSRMLIFIRAGTPVSEAFFKTLHLTGNAVFFTGITLAIGVSTWLISALEFQVDMGVLLAFMFLFNMIGSVILLPALSAILYRN